LWWDDTPVDVFLNNHPFHDTVAGRVTWVPLERREIPVLDCASLVVFKALFNRTRDWADIEAVSERSPGDIEKAAATIEEMLGADDAIYRRLVSLAELAACTIDLSSPHPDLRDTARACRARTWRLCGWAW